MSSSSSEAESGGEPVSGYSIETAEDTNTDTDTDTYPSPNHDCWTLEEWREEATAAIRAAKAEDATDFGGGVPTVEVASRLPRDRDVVCRGLNSLVDAGHLIRIQGANPETGFSRPGYIIPSSDEEEQQTVTPDELKSPWKRIDHSHPTWSDEHGIISELLPFAYLPFSAFEHLKKITEFLQSRPVYCQSISRQALRGQLDIPDSAVGWKFPHIEIACLINGWWYTEDVADSSRYFVNPDYCHGHTDEWLITDPEKRKQYVKKCLRYGLSAERASTACDLSPRAIQKCYCPKLEFDDEEGIDTWQEFAEAARYRRHRTYRTLSLWGHSSREIATAFNIGKGTVHRALKRTADFDPPTDPTFDVPENAKYKHAKVVRR